MTFSSNLAENPDSKLCPGHLMHHRRNHSRPDCRPVNAMNLRFRRVILLAVALLGPMTANAAAAESLRCGTQLIREGDLGIQVREKCGDPISEELIGYTLRGAPPGLRGEREYKIEQWIFGPDQGYYHVLIFEGGRLHSIENIRR